MEISLLERGRNSCPIWNTLARGQDDIDHNEAFIESPRAGGQYVITKQAEHSVGQLSDRAKARLTSWLVDQRRLGNRRPEIYRETLKIEGEQRKDLPIPKRADRLLQYIESQFGEIGKNFVFTSNRMDSIEAGAWSESVNSDEVNYLLDYLCRQNWLERIKDTSYPHSYILTVEGYTRLAELTGDTADTRSSTVFVAMWFHKSTDKAWEEGIKPGIEDAGYEAVRIDEKEHNRKIDDEIIAEIRRSRFIVADFTQGEDGVRGGVYYEAGFAHGLGIEVFFTCKKDVLGHVHFDTRQYNHIDWETPEDLRERLARRISAVIGDGPLSE